MTSPATTEAAPILLHVEHGVARITLNRPEAGNALDLPTVSALLDAVIACEHDPAVRCVVIAANGKLFCAGGDIGAFQAHGANLGAYLGKLAALLHSAVARMAAMPKPVVSLVHGPAAGAGMSLALAASHVLAGPRATFTTAYGRIGLTADGGMTWLLPRLVGLRRASELMASSRTVAADEALALGLVSEVIDDAAFEAVASARITALADSAVGAIGRTKALLMQSFEHSLEHHLECELAAITAAANGPECREGVRAFLARSAPDFRKAATE